MVTPSTLPLFRAAPQLLGALKKRYDEPHRHYHCWAHIEQLLGLYGEIGERLSHHEAVLYALYYHDAIYAIPSSANEEDSAALFEAEAANHIDRDTAETAKQFIIATKNHELSANLSKTQRTDCQYFLDTDMSILGAAPDAYRQYASDVRREYGVFPDEMYNHGRLQVLNDFLARDRIFLTDYFHERLEKLARVNISQEIARLQA